jgi:tryptophan 7-halogenase
LLTYFPGHPDCAAERERFNRETVQEYIDIRDFLILHYHATERDDSKFWNTCRTQEPPPSLVEKLAMFRSSGRVIRNHNELFTETSWLAVLTGQGIAAGGHHPAADLLSDAEARERLDHIAQVVASNAAAMPSQAQFLEMIGGAIDPQDIVRA